MQLDLGKFEKDLHTAPVSLQGSISATLVSLERTIEQYRDQLKRYETTTIQDVDESKDAKFQARLDSLVEAHRESAARFAELKKEYNSSNARAQLFNKNETYMVDGDSVMNKRNVANMGSTSPRNSFDVKNGGLPLYNGLQKEQSIFQRGNAQLELILEMGHQSLDDLVEQNQILQKMQDTMSSSLRTLGVSEGTIQNINRRAFKDKLIFWFALALMLIGFYFVLKWFR